MAWVSPKIYAILKSSEEGKDILEGIADKDQAEVDKEVDAFFGKGGKGEKDANAYTKAKMDDKAEENEYQSMGNGEAKNAVSGKEKVKMSNQSTRNKLTGGYTRLGNIQNKFDMNSTVESAKDAYSKMSELKSEFEQMWIDDSQDFDKEDKEKLVKQIDDSMKRLSKDWPEVLDFGLEEAKNSFKKSEMKNKK